MSPTPPDLPALRDALARAALALDDAPIPHRLGADALHPHQRLALARLRSALHTTGGALLADDVGLGKTHVALALAADARHPLVVAPAALRHTWTTAARAAAVPIRFASTESLGRPAFAPHPPAPDLLIVDEAHHFRTPTTRRWRRLADLARHGRTLLLTATPVHNAPRDLVTLLALFLGARAHTLDPATLAHLLVRRRAADLPTPAHPAVARTRWHPLPDDPELLATLLALPPPVPPRDGGRAGALVGMTLVRLWASSDAALRAALQRRLTRAAALQSALAHGRHLARRELRAWCVDDATVQLALPLDAPLADPDGRASRTALHDALAAHAAGCRHALARLDARTDHDARRVAWLRALRQRHPGQVIVAFTQFADTARALYRHLAPDGRVALLTAGGGRIASGPVPRHELLARLALPHPSTGRSPTADAPRIDHVALLLATDCLAEGLDLRAASVVAHLDVPWTPARLAQRVGRAARLGAPHSCIHVHALAPPIGLAAWLRLGDRLRRKAAAAHRLLGAPSPSDPRPDAPLRGALRLARRLERWIRLDPPPAPSPRAAPASHILAVRIPGMADRPAAFLAACALDGRTWLVGGHALGRASAHPRRVAPLARHLDHAAAAPISLPPAAWRSLVDAARRALGRWARRRRAHLAAGALLAPPATALLDRPPPSHIDLPLRGIDGAAPDGAGDEGAHGAARRRSPTSSVVPRALARVGAALAHAPPTRRVALAAQAAELRAALHRPLGGAAERALAALSPDLADADWLAAACAAVRPAESRLPLPSYGGAAPPGRLRLLALVLLVPDTADRA